ncbi:MAG: DnaB-like helicase C-terminal domain-containing protein [Planctomycetaceae bacterium]
MNDDIRLPPQDLSAERGVLGSLLFWNEAYDSIGLKPEDFYGEANATIYVAFSDLWRRGCRGIDAVTLAEELQCSGKLEEAGGVAYLLEIIENVPHAAHVKYYADIVAEKARLRAIIYAATDAMRKAYSCDPSAEIVTATFGRMEQVVDRGAVEFSTIDDALDELRDLRANPVARQMTGLSGLDFRLGGGFRPGQSIIVAGRPGSGKSVLACQFARAFAARNEPVLIVSLEMAKWEIAERLERCDPNNLEALPMYFDECSQKADAIVRAIRRAKRKHGIGLAVLDYLQLVEPDDKKANRERQVAEVSRAVKLLARELKIPIVSGCQLNRQSVNEKRKPRLGDLRESGSIEQDADIVLMLHDGDGGDDGEVDDQIIVAKHRGGMTGVVKVEFNKPRSLFTEREPWTGGL